MLLIKNEDFAHKANQYKRPLKHRTVHPRRLVQMQADEHAFQGYSAVALNDIELPFYLRAGESITLDFGEHCVGYLNFSFTHTIEGPIVDSPLLFSFSFGEFPLEIVTPPESYEGSLGPGWLQTETRSYVFTPYTGSLERRYAFRYVKIRRLDRHPCTIAIHKLFADCVSAVDCQDVPPCEISDPTLQRIYDMSLKTLMDCEQDVFEDGPKRDRRLWIGDLRLQALTDYTTFQNLDLVKRCLYLFAAYRTEDGLVAPCVFPDSPPYVDNWTFTDYSLYFVSCLYDYIKHTGDMEILRELYPIAMEQITLISQRFDKKTGTIQGRPFIDWCPGLDGSVAVLGVYLFTLRQMLELSNLLQKEEDASGIRKEIADVQQILTSFQTKANGLFVTLEGQISWHSQIWAILSDALSLEESRKLLRATQNLNPSYIPHTPYMMHCYLEALNKCGWVDEMFDVIKDFWGKIAEAGFDCCPEVFNPKDPLESPYRAPEINSACHAWSCTPAYWIQKHKNFINNIGGHHHA